jgi:hypothetical protein
VPEHRLTSITEHLSGAPLDAIKLAAAVLMLGDHVNTALLSSSVPLLWRFGRIAFPLFCFVLACHLVRGADAPRYARGLLLVAIATQPAFAAAFRVEFANVLITLAAGAVLAGALLSQDGWRAHLTLAAGTAVVFAWQVRARTGVDFGLAGILFPAALALVLAGARWHIVWAAVLLFSLNAWANRGPDETWLRGASVDALFAGLGGLATIGLALLLRGKARFLPRYALYLFYPGHLLALAALRAWGVGAS